MMADAIAAARRARPRFRKPLGRCYELAFNTLFNLPDADGWTLVHGEVRGEPPDHPRIGHAWLEFGEVVSDPVLDQGYDRVAYEKRFAAIARCRYTKRQAADTMLSANHLV